MHQAVEVGAGVHVTPEQNVDARISRQRYFQMYQRLSGLTGTAVGHETEFGQFFQLPVVSVPTHKACLRKVDAPQYFANSLARDQAVVRDVQRRTSRGQPVLVGTRSIAQSRQLSSQFHEAHLEHVVLNGTQQQDEAEIVARAGDAATVTIATNMAGRGTDIRLAGSAKSAGGLHVIAAGHQDSRRVDRQLIGRCARQGEPGSCCFFSSADDDFLTTHARELADTMRQSADASGRCASDYSADIATVQNRVEKAAFARRQQLVEQDAWLDSVLNSLARRA